MDKYIFLICVLNVKAPKYLVTFNVDSGQKYLGT